MRAPLSVLFRRAGLVFSAPAAVAFALAGAALLSSSSGCGERASCLEGPSSRSPERTISLCTRHYERTGDPRAAIAAVLAHGAKKDDDAVLRWAERVGDTPGTAQIWRRAAQVYQRRDQHEAMVAAGHRAMALWEQQGKPGEAAYEGHILKGVHWQRSELLPALEVSRKARALALVSDDTEMRRITLFDLFTLLGDVGDYAGASQMIREGQAQLDRGDAEGQRALRVAEGLMHFRRGDLELAKLAYREAIDGAPASDNTRSALYNLVEIEAMLGEVAAAERDLAAAVGMIPEEPTPSMLAARAFFTALVENARGAPDQAAATLTASLAAEPVLDWRWQLELVLGAAHESRGQVSEALAAYRRAIAAVEEMREEVVIDVLQVALRDRKRTPYEAVFELEARRGEVAAAMATAQLMWQRGFVESFVEGDEGQGAPEPQERPAGEDVAAERIRGLAPLAPQLMRTGGATATVTTGSGAVARGDLLTPASEALAFVEARGGLWRYHRPAARAGAAAEPRLERLALSAERARRLVAEVRARPEELAAARELAAALVPAEVLAPERRGQELILVADGALAGLPFSALRSGTRWLVEVRIPVYQPSLAPLAAAASTQTGAPDAAPASPAKTTPGPVASSTALPGAVVLAASSSSSSSGARGDRLTLAAASREAERVGELLGVTPKLGTAATIAALRGGAAAPLLHLAAHGGLAPGGAFVRLADGAVTVTDVVTWRLAPDVVVLASCASGARPSGSLWGALGGAFLAAGSRAVVATLWSVEDEATAELISQFYAAGGALAPARALAAAQRAAISAGVSPRHWAAFVVLTGS